MAIKEYFSKNITLQEYNYALGVLGAIGENLLLMPLRCQHPLGKVFLMLPGSEMLPREVFLDSPKVPAVPVY